jgi:hypothetical protein
MHVVIPNVGVTVPLMAEVLDEVEYWTLAPSGNGVAASEFSLHVHVGLISP